MESNRKQAVEEDQHTIEIWPLVEIPERFLDAIEDKEDAIAKMSMCAAASKRLKDISDAIEGAVVEFIEENGDFEFNGIRYYAGHNKTTKCLDRETTLILLYDIFEDDVSKLLAHLTSQPFKHGACRGALTPEQFDSVFETTETPKLKEGKPKKRVQHVDPKYLPPKHSDADDEDSFTPPRSSEDKP